MTTALYIIGGFVLVIIGVVLAGGAMISRDHTATRCAEFNHPPEDIWDAITRTADFPAWRTGLARVEILDPIDGKVCWVEHSRHGQMKMVIVSQIPSRRMVTRIADDSLPFGGTWMFELEPTTSGTRVRITEEGIIKPPPFRFMARFIFGYAATMEQYLRDLGKNFGADVTIEP